MYKGDAIILDSDVHKHGNPLFEKLADILDRAGHGWHNGSTPFRKLDFYQVYHSLRTKYNSKEYCVLLGTYDGEENGILWSSIEYSRDNMKRDVIPLEQWLHKHGGVGKIDVEFI